MDDKFWWGYKEGKQHNLSLQSWNKICLPKSLGGIGIRKMGEVKMALLSKMGWLLTTSSSRPWVHSLKAKYLRQSHFLQVDRKCSDFWFWKCILKSRPVLNQGRCFVVSTGLDI